MALAEQGNLEHNHVAQCFASAGLELSRRQPGSGIYADFPHDVELRHKDRRYIVECKARKNGFATLDNWRGQADMLVVKADRKEPCVYMPLSVLRELLEE